MVAEVDGLAAGRAVVVGIFRVSGAGDRRGTPLGAWREGIRRANSAPGVLVGVWVLTVAVSIPLALAVRLSIRDQLGASLEADTAASGMNYDWLQEFAGEARGIDATVQPTIIGFAAVLDNLSAFVDDESRPALVAAAAAAYVLLLTFLAGGIIDRFARDRATRAHGFFSACGGFFVRFIRLGVLAGIVYGLLFGVVHPWLFQSLFPHLTANTTVERTAFLVRVALYALFLAALAIVNVLFDYAKVRAVVEDRRSMSGALRAAAGFIGRNRAAVAALYLIDAAAFLVVLLLYAAVAPGAGSAGWLAWLAFALGQLYVLARLWVKLVFWASETSLFQARLAHAGFVRRPLPQWPESAAAEAITRSATAGPMQPW
jgi:hypothetical protein